jgi:hypothetical protein
MESDDDGGYEEYDNNEIHFHKTYGTNNHHRISQTTQPHLLHYHHQQSNPTSDDENEETNSYNNYSSNSYNNLEGNDSTGSAGVGEIDLLKKRNGSQRFIFEMGTGASLSYVSLFFFVNILNALNVVVIIIIIVIRT